MLLARKNGEGDGRGDHFIRKQLPQRKGDDKRQTCAPRPGQFHNVPNECLFELCSIRSFEKRNKKDEDNLG